LKKSASGKRVSENAYVTKAIVSLTAQGRKNEKKFPGRLIDHAKPGGFAGRASASAEADTAWPRSQMEPRKFAADTNGNGVRECSIGKFSGNFADASGRSREP